MLYPKNKYGIEISENPHSNSFSIWFKNKPEDLVFHLLRAMKFRSRSYGREFYHPEDANARQFAEELQQTLRKGYLPEVVHYIPSHEPSENSITKGKFSIATVYHQNAEQKTVHYEFVIFENSRPARESYAWLIAHLKHGESFKKLKTSEKIRINEAIDMFHAQNFKTKLPIPFGGDFKNGKMVRELSQTNFKNNLANHVKEDGNKLGKEDRIRDNLNSNYIPTNTSDSELYKVGKIVQKEGGKKDGKEDRIFHQLSQLYKDELLDEELAFDSRGRIIPIQELGDNQPKILRDFKYRIPVKFITIKSTNGESEHFDSWERVERFISNWEVENISSQKSLEAKILWENGCQFQMHFNRASFTPFTHHFKNLLGKVVFHRLLHLFQLHKREEADSFLLENCPKSTVLKLIKEMDFGFPVHTYFATADFKIPIQEIKIDTGDSKVISVDDNKADLPFAEAIKQLEFAGSLVGVNQEISISFKWIDEKEVQLSISPVDIPATIDNDFIEQLLQSSFKENELRYYQVADSDALINPRTLNYIEELFIKAKEPRHYDETWSAEIEAISERYHEDQMRTLARTVAYYYVQLNAKEKRLFFKQSKKKCISSASIDKLLDEKIETPAQEFRFHEYADLVFINLFDYRKDWVGITIYAIYTLLKIIYKLNRRIFLNDVPALSQHLAFNYLLPWSSYRRLRHENTIINRFDLTIDEKVRKNHSINDCSREHKLYILENLQGTFGDFAFFSPEEKVGVYFPKRSIAKLMWELAYKHGYKNGSVVQPAAGIGTFLETAPKNIPLRAYEECKRRHKVQQNLYPLRSTINRNFSDFFKREDLRIFDLTIGCPPFYSMKEGKKRITDLQDNIVKIESEIWYLKRGIEVLRTNGLLVYLISSFFMKDKLHYLEEKRQIESMADLKALYRLPKGIVRNVPTSFDIVVYQKKPINAS